MTLIEVKCIPETRRKKKYNRIPELFENFLDMHVRIAVADIDYASGEYKNFRSAYETLLLGSKRYPEYRVRVASRNGVIYLMRTDM